MLVDMPAIPDATRAAPPPSTASVAPGAKFADTLAASTNAVLPETEANPSCVSDRAPADSTPGSSAVPKGAAASNASQQAPPNYRLGARVEAKTAAPAKNSKPAMRTTSKNSSGTANTSAPELANAVDQPDSANSATALPAQLPQLALSLANLTQSIVLPVPQANGVSGTASVPVSSNSSVKVVAEADESSLSPPSHTADSIAAASVSMPAAASTAQMVSSPQSASPQQIDSLLQIALSRKIVSPLSASEVHSNALSVSGEQAPAPSPLPMPAAANLFAYSKEAASSLGSSSCATTNGGGKLEEAGNFASRGLSDFAEASGQLNTNSPATLLRTLPNVEPFNDVAITGEVAGSGDGSASTIDLPENVLPVDVPRFQPELASPGFAFTRTTPSVGVAHAAIASDPSSVVSHSFAVEVVVPSKVNDPSPKLEPASSGDGAERSAPLRGPTTFSSSNLDNNSPPPAVPDHSAQAMAGASLAACLAEGSSVGNVISGAVTVTSGSQAQVSTATSNPASSAVTDSKISADPPAKPAESNAGSGPTTVDRPKSDTSAAPAPFSPTSSAVSESTPDAASNVSLAVPSPAPGAPGPATPDKSGASSPLPPAHQMLDSAPAAFANAPARISPSAHLPSDPAALQMHLGVHTNAFGNVEIHTIVEQSQVGVAIHGDRDLARWFNSEVGGLETGLKNQHLNLAGVDFSSNRSGVQTATSFQHGQPRQDLPQNPHTYVAASTSGAMAPAPVRESDLIPALPVQGPEPRVSILA